MRLTYYCLLFGILTPLLTQPARARAFDDEEDDDLGRKLAEMQLIRTADMVADPLSLIPFPWGNDELEEGSIEVRARRLLSVMMQGVPPGATFSVQFCTLVNAPTRCAELGQVQSDDEGLVRGVIPFPEEGNPWVGFFAVQRDAKTMYVSGFGFPPPPPPAGSATVTLTGRILSLNVPDHSFTVEGFLPVVRIDAGTRFLGKLKLADLQMGMNVEVEGATQADGTLLAARVKAKREKD